MSSPKNYTVTAAVVGGCLGLYALAGFIVLPAIVTSKAPELIAEATGQRPQLQTCRFNPFTFQAEIEGFSLPSADGKPLIEFAKLAVDLDLLQSIRRGGAVLSSLSLSAPMANVQRRADGSFNFSDVIPKSSPETNAEPAKDQAAPLLLIHQLSIDHGQLSWSDATQGEQLQEVQLPFDLNVQEFSTRANGNSSFALELEMASGGRLQWHGELSLAALSSSGQIQLDDLNLLKVWQLCLSKLMPLAITDGHLSLHSDYRFSYADSPQLLINQGSVELKQLQLADKKKTADSLISVPSLTVQGINFDLGKQQVTLASVNSNDAVINAWLEKDGHINYETLFAADTSNAAPPKPAAEPAAASPWHIQLNDLALSNYQIKFTDHQLSKPVALNLSELNCKLQNFKGVDGGKFPLQLSARFNQTGTLTINGDLNPDPFAGDWTVALRDIKLKTFQPYLDSAINLELVEGDFASQGHLVLNTAKELQVIYQGDANIDSLITRDKVKFKDFVKWANLDVNQIAIDVAKQQYTFGKVLFDKPYVRFTIKKDRSTNVDDIIGQPAEPESPAKSTTAATHKSQADPVIRIGSIEIADGKSDFADYSLILPFIAEMNKLNGEVDGFTSNTDQAAKLKLKGKVYDLATVNINGDYQFQSNDSNIALNFSHMPLPLVTPYMAEFAGYKIEKGQMALDLHYAIKHGQLDASNKILIDQLKLGEKVENPKAVSLPLELAIALLKDADGKINLDFPISGSLEDPKFSIGSMVGDILVNLVTKVVTSPFKAIAALAGGDSGVDLSNIRFAAGSSELSAEETDKLGHVSQALASKPVLTLEVKGLAYLIQDWPTLRSAVVTDVLKKMKSGELRDKGEKIRSEYLVLSDEDYKRLLAKFYAEVFPQEIDFNLIGKPRMKHNPDVDFYRIAQLQLEAIMQPDEQKLNALAIARANSIASYLSEQAHVDRSRIYFLATETRTGSSDGDVNTLLSLNVSQ